MKILTTVLVLIGLSATAFAEGVCEGANRERLCLKMRHLRAGINALDAQRELMQVNPYYILSLGYVLVDTAEKTRAEYGFGIPEHISGLAGVQRLGREMVQQATQNNLDMLKTANNVRNQCASCHTNSNHVGGVEWDNIFDYDWSAIALHCNTSNKNPYLCRSMNGLMSAYGYFLTAYQADLPNFSMTRRAADEVVRILLDLKTKGFQHLPEELRVSAENEARQVSIMASAQDSAVFAKAAKLTNACQTCHENTGSGPDHFGNFSIRNLNWTRKK